MIGARNLLVWALVIASCEPAYACPVAAQGVSAVDIVAGCPAPFDGVLHTEANDQARRRAADEAEDALRAAAKKIRGLEAAIEAVPEPPSRVEWFIYGAVSAILATGSVALVKGTK